jgi:hypothetical protein
MVELLPSKCEALSSNPSAAKKKEYRMSWTLLAPVILATREAEFWRIMVRGHLRGPGVCQVPSQKKKAGYGGTHLSSQRQQEP